MSIALSNISNTEVSLHYVSLAYSFSVHICYFIKKSPKLLFHVMYIHLMAQYLDRWESACLFPKEMLHWVKQN